MKGQRKSSPIASFLPCKMASDRCWSRGSSPNVGLYVREAEIAQLSNSRDVERTRKLKTEHQAKTGIVSLEAKFGSICEMICKPKILGSCLKQQIGTFTENIIALKTTELRSGAAKVTSVY